METEQIADAPHEKKLSGAQRKRAWAERERTLDEKGVLRLNIWQPHERVLRGKVRP